MSWEGPGFVDHHAHLLSVAIGRQPSCCQGDSRDEIAAWHHLVLQRWSTPMDQPAPPVVYQPAPTYRVVSSRPDYTVVTTRPAPAPAYVPVTRYYYD